MHASVKMQFDAIANDYDRQRKQLIPCFDEFYGMAVSLVECEPSSKVLDLGSGTGLFAGLVMQKYPDIHLTLMDLSDSMLDGARARFSRTDRVQYIVGDYSEYAFSGQYDAVISSLSIHHLTHPDKQRLFHTVYRLLRSGGIFVNADQVQGHTPAADAYYRKQWLEAIHRSGLTQEAIDSSIERRKLDINATLSDQIGWLEAAGFTDVDCMYKYLDFAVFYGKKA
ncbi:class I SAM-dependent methyltransferase [Paenibacillus thalictri]|uniref:Class I SAM-dependent methyltransferase n=1 Tax=Paenibacillus thalictri TaxID=2527873 RepID=A0A4Q9DMR1_9BACL|nr:class I SAM-dependent methyltransferase [Paenibacillus thalictri]TBL75389.1 class I SAM-dependent methyltransferase [Paenibacillus thalictri]